MSIDASRFLSFLRCQEGTGDYQKVLSSGWPQSELIEFKNVFLRYRPNTEIVLRHLSFKVTPKEKLGIVGELGLERAPYAFH